ncbi:acetyl-CoA acetyltransferase [Phlebotomus argentipes]|uniref:acetyl-CoA acetyltransferase n=1 Tax=Phlebotomus argentipes TaxID=94469 RepID=UPI00289342C1|nr:acetyl-CoA acetyltransferase [Phlebotomus argentipes]XP_059620845.1 acetyl-CoA acetyltransferase [Phlebotomus argentipes]
MSLTNVFIVSAARTPIGSFNGCFSKLSAADLGAVAIREVLSRANVKAEDVSEVILGQALTAGQGQNPGRQAALAAGLPLDVPAYVLNMLCGSGLKTVQLGFQAIRSGEATIVVCGGQESMTKAPHAIHLRDGVRMGPGTMVDTMLVDGLTDAQYKIHMGVTAENLAEKHSITREEQDAYALRSQQLTEESQKKGYFDKEIVPVTLKDRKGVETKVTQDEYPKHGASLADMQKLKPAFNPTGTVTAANASGINDSAAAVLLMGEEEMKRRNLQPLARIVAFAQGGVDPRMMGAGPVPAVNAVCARAGWRKEDVEVFELNEAFAAQAIAVQRELELDPARINIHGGAIALGHPIGASGCRVLVTLLYAMERTNARKGIASLCIGGGMGIAIAVERA